MVSVSNYWGADHYDSSGSRHFVLIVRCSLSLGGQGEPLYSSPQSQPGEKRLSPAKFAAAPSSQALCRHLPGLTPVICCREPAELASEGLLAVVERAQRGGFRRGGAM